jgi:hypothetical protein
MSGSSILILTRSPFTERTLVAICSSLKVHGPGGRAWKIR